MGHISSGVVAPITGRNHVVLGVAALVVDSVQSYTDFSLATVGTPLGNLLSNERFVQIIWSTF
jgi:hypothetical protein